MFAAVESFWSQAAPPAVGGLVVVFAVWAFRYGTRISRAVERIETATNHVGEGQPSLVEMVGSHGALLRRHGELLVSIDKKADLAVEHAAQAVQTAETAAEAAARIADRLQAMGAELLTNTAITVATRDAQ